jgi:hypothetical protein
VCDCLKKEFKVFVFSHSEKVKYKGNPCPNFLRGSLDIVGGSRRIKML